MRRVQVFCFPLLFLFGFPALGHNGTFSVFSHTSSLLESIERDEAEAERKRDRDRAAWERQQIKWEIEKIKKEREREKFLKGFGFGAGDTDGFFIEGKYD